MCGLVSPVIAAIADWLILEFRRRPLVVAALTKARPTWFSILAAVMPARIAIAAK
jgi:hypothetical protein